MSRHWSPRSIVQCGCGWWAPRTRATHSKRCPRCDQRPRVLTGDQLTPEQQTRLERANSNR